MPTVPANKYEPAIWPPPALADGISALGVDRMDLEDLATVAARGDVVTAAHPERAILLASDFERRADYERKIEALKEKIHRAITALQPIIPSGDTSNRTIPGRRMPTPGTPTSHALSILLS